MNILHVTQHISSLGGGVAKYVNDLVQWQIKAGHCVNVLATDFNDKEVPNYAVTFRKLPPNFLGRTQVLSYLKNLTKKPNILHIHGLRVVHNAIAAKWAYVNKIPYVVSPHAQLHPWTLAKRRWKKIPYDFFVERGFLQRSSMIHFVSEYERDVSAYKKIWQDKTYISPIGLNDEDWTLFPAESIVALQDKVKIVTFFAIVSYRKGIDLFIDSIPEVLKQKPDTKFVIAGRDPESLQATLQERARKLGVLDKIVWILPIKREQARWLLEKSSIYVLPSRAESFGISILESLAVGTPVVISRETSWDCDGNKLIGENCELNADSISKKILTILCDKCRLTNYPKRIDWVKENFQWDVIGQQIINMYQHLI